MSLNLFNQFTNLVIELSRYNIFIENTQYENDIITFQARGNIFIFHGFKEFSFSAFNKFRSSENAIHLHHDRIAANGIEYYYNVRPVR